MAIKNNDEQVLVRVKGNTEKIGATLRNNLDTADVDVTAATILFRMVRIDNKDGTRGQVKVDNASATVDSGTDGEVSYSPSASDMDTPGTYAAYFIIDDTIDKRFPYDGAKFLIKIIEETETVT